MSSSGGRLGRRADARDGGGATAHGLAWRRRDKRRDANSDGDLTVRGADRIDPMPVGVEEFDYMNGGWAYVDTGRLIIYGHNVR